MHPIVADVWALVKRHKKKLAAAVAVVALAQRYCGACSETLQQIITILAPIVE